MNPRRFTPLARPLIFRSPKFALVVITDETTPDVKTTEDNGAVFVVIKAFHNSHDRLSHHRPRRPHYDIDCPDHLAFTLAVPARFKGHTVVDIAFKPIRHGTRKVFQQTGVAPEVVVPGWQMMFDRLEGWWGRGGWIASACAPLGVTSAASAAPRWLADSWADPKLTVTFKRGYPPGSCRCWELCAEAPSRHRTNVQPMSK